MTDDAPPCSFPSHLLLVGCGNMAGQMLARWLDCGLPPSHVTVLRPSGRPVADGITVVTDYPTMLAVGTTILLGMKPYQLDDVATALNPLIRADTPIVSILAGTPLAELRARCPGTNDIVRAMPNLPVGIGQGVTALYADTRTSPLIRDVMEALMAPLGMTEWLSSESLFNAVTALSGCGPAFLFRFVDALARAGEAIGLPTDQAARMALATVQGSANMAAGAIDGPAVLADRVASPGGMTRKGLDVLDLDKRLLALLTDTLVAARDRGEAMARGE